MRREISQDEEGPAGMRPAGRLDDRPRLAIGLVQLVIATIGVGLEDPGITGQMRLRVLAAAIARIVEHRRRRVGAGKWPVIPYIQPAPAQAGVHTRPVIVLPLASTGTVVSSPCSRSAAKTCPSTRRNSGASTATHAPTWSAKVDRLSGTPSLA